MYKNTFGWCNYPFKNNALGHCLDYAKAINTGRNKEEIYKMCSKKVKVNNKISKTIGLKESDYWCKYYKPKLIESEGK